MEGKVKCGRSVVYCKLNNKVNGDLMSVYAAVNVLIYNENIITIWVDRGGSCC